MTTMTTITFIMMSSTTAVTLNNDVDEIRHHISVLQHPAQYPSQHTCSAIRCPRPLYAWRENRERQAHDSHQRQRPQSMPIKIAPHSQTYWIRCRPHPSLRCRDCWRCSGCSFCMRKKMLTSLLSSARSLADRLPPCLCGNWIRIFRWQPLWLGAATVNILVPRSSALLSMTKFEDYDCDFTISAGR